MFDFCFFLLLLFLLLVFFLVLLFVLICSLLFFLSVFLCPYRPRACSRCAAWRTMWRSTSPCRQMPTRPSSRPAWAPSLMVRYAHVCVCVHVCLLCGLYLGLCVLAVPVARQHGRLLVCVCVFACACVCTLCGVVRYVIVLWLISVCTLLQFLSVFFFLLLFPTAPEKDNIVWSIKQFPGGREFLMRAHFGLPSIHNGNYYKYQYIYLNIYKYREGRRRKQRLQVVKHNLHTRDCFLITLTIAI